jgi:hypothetical protein
VKAGDCLRPFQIVVSIGTGGMGEVSGDTKLNRRIVVG